jgi:hypothetical protein
MRKIKKHGVSYWKTKAWHEFSIFIRNRDNSKLGCRCFTCGKYYPTNRMQAGHYVSRRINCTLFNEMNVHAQCYNCNINLKGDIITYKENLIKEYGEDKVKVLEDMRHVIKQWKTFELEEIYNKYKALNKTNENINA